jgi:hypothetical protein
MIEEAKEELLKNKGAIVNISSVAALIPSSHWGIYGVVKAAQDKMTTNLAFGVPPRTPGRCTQAATAQARARRPADRTLRCGAVCAQGRARQLGPARRHPDRGDREHGGAPGPVDRGHVQEARQVARHAARRARRRGGPLRPRLCSPRAVSRRQNFLPGGAGCSAAARRSHVQQCVAGTLAERDEKRKCDQHMRISLPGQPGDLPAIVRAHMRADGAGCAGGRGNPVPVLQRQRVHNGRAAACGRRRAPGVLAQQPRGWPPEPQREGGVSRAPTRKPGDRNRVSAWACGQLQRCRRGPLCW